MTNDIEFKELEKKAKQAKNMEDLFSAWKTAHTAEECESLSKTLPKCKGSSKYPEDKNFIKNFTPDGVTSIEGNVSIDSLEVEVLFVLKEANTSGKYREYHSFWFNEAADKTRQKYSNKFEKVLEKLNKSTKDKFGYMNLNKRGGFGSTDKTQLEQYTKKYKSFILKQIELHNPNIIIFCGCYDDIAKILFEKDVNGNDIKTWKKKPVEVNLNGKKILLYSVYHPSSRGNFNKSLDVFDENKV